MHLAIYVERRMSNWLGVIIVPKGFTSYLNSQSVNSGKDRFEGDEATENGITRLSSYDLSAPVLEWSGERIRFVRVFSNVLEVSLAREAGAESRRVFKISGTLYDGRKLVFDMPFRQAIIKQVGQRFWCAGQGVKSYLEDGAGKQDSTGALPFREKYAPKGELMLWEAPPVGAIDGQFVLADEDYLQLALCVAGKPGSSDEVQRLTTKFPAIEAYWCPSALGAGGAKLINTFPHFIGCKDGFWAGDKSAQKDEKNREWWCASYPKGLMAGGADSEESETPASSKELEVSPMFMHVNRGDNGVEIHTSVSATATLVLPAQGALAGKTYTPPRNVTEGLNYDEPKKCKTKVNALLRESALQPIDLDKVKVTAGAASAESNFLIFNTPQTHYFRVSKEGGGVRLKLFYDGWDGEVEVSRGNIEWKMLAGSGSLNGGLVTPSSNAADRFVTIVAYDVSDSDRRYWYFSVITIPCPMLSVDKAVDVLK